MMLKTGTYFPNFTFYILFTDIVAVIMSTDNKEYDKMYFESRKIKDDSEERALLLAEKNKALQEKQNYEIYAATLPDTFRERTEKRRYCF